MATENLVDHSPHHPDPAPPVATASNLVLIDNYDSFTWNVYQYLVLEGAKVTVFRNDQISLEELIAKQPTQLVISPGPGHPGTDSGISRDAIRHFAGKIPIFGVCMGQQCILDVYGGDVSFAGEILHGKTSPLTHDSRGVYANMAQGLPVTRYHSLAGTHVTLPQSLEVTSWIPKADGTKGVIMGVRHKEFVIEGVQFHPESILSKDGRIMIKNFLHMQGGTWAENERIQKLSAAKAHRDPAQATIPVPSKKQGNILQQIYDRRKELVAAQKRLPSQRPGDLQAAYDLNAAPPQISFVERLRQTPFNLSLMAEIKRGSPSKGVFALDIDAPTQAKKYALAGASVISVLTEPDWFKGSIEDLKAVRQVLHAMPNRPAILRKEFIFEEYQILEARLAGADSVLLIVKMLDFELLTRLYKYSQSLGMEPLVEVQNAEEMDIAVKLGSKAIGVNNRNLETFDVDLNTTSRLRSLVPKETVICALSGINTHEDVMANHKDGVNAVLVGEAIMRAPDASEFIQQLCSGKVTKEKSPVDSLLVKICGTRTPEAALVAAEAGADLVGIILAPGRKRTVSDEAAQAISKAVHSFSRPASANGNRFPANNIARDFFASATQKITAVGRTRPLLVGVFLNQPLSEVLELQRKYNLDIVQLHGSEPIEWASLIPVPVIRRFTAGAPGVGARGYHVVPLFDPGAGSGQLLDAVDVKATLAKDPELRLLLAGGLDPANLSEVVKNVGADAERVIGVDVSSGVEDSNGEQSLDRIREFVSVAKGLR
ncbi:indole-3-glycerol phosphate synthase-domain-containing protein [Microdochium trichocladiopsis]|uniref:Multifunctional tryptophan biosynthesis protein n=1 Tax=Microdochium trichocladiopsis TaxID=1682393 RepID=A0A9P8YJX5_9PEZI|nr:indole-3-glycerol phosphate synthase-domain-containing protein [Microdochium trichocladiopsis]KAH7041253.1 indole-3-glycerol phosphate synthase-domain-containing protein [Microdochium trichocladiopsis]